MPSESSPFPSSDVESRVALVHCLASGKLESLECPKCNQSCVTVWFTHPLANEYRTWFLCSNCDFEMRVQNSEKPAHYSDERINHALEVRDREILEQRRLNADGQFQTP